MKHSTFSGDLFVLQIEESIKTFSSVLEDAATIADGAGITGQLKSIEDAIEFLSSAITNRLQSGRFLYETTLFNPHSMGSFSELYSFYESFVDLFQRLIISYNNTREPLLTQPRLSFLLDISTHSSVSTELFLPSTSESLGINRLVGITINETSFFQIKDTIILLLHEIGHYARPWDRAVRNEAVLDVLIDWIADETLQQINYYLDFEEFSGPAGGRPDPRTDIVEQIADHFEQILTLIEPLLQETLERYFNDFVASGATDRETAITEQYSNKLHIFQDTLQDFLLSLSTHMRDSLLWPKARAGSPILYSTLVELLEKRIPANWKEIAGRPVPTYFEYLCQLATELFEPGETFGDAEWDHEAGNASIESYLNGLSLLGLNEGSKQNCEYFVDTLMKCLLKSVDTLLHKQVLEMIIKNTEESLAHLFWIRTLNIRDFRTYWNIMENLIDKTTFSELDRISCFGISNAILTEYFSLLEHGEVPEVQTYLIPPLPVSYFVSEHGSPSPEHFQTVIDHFRNVYFVPIAYYLLEEDGVFPEKWLFQMSPDGPLSPDGALVAKLREDFLRYLGGNQNGATFSDENQLIHFFENGGR